MNHAKRGIGGVQWTLVSTGVQTYWRDGTGSIWTFEETHAQTSAPCLPRACAACGPLIFRPYEAAGPRERGICLSFFGAGQLLSKHQRTQHVLQLKTCYGGEEMPDIYSVLRHAEIPFGGNGRPAYIHALL